MELFIEKNLDISEWLQLFQPYQLFTLFPQISDLIKINTTVLPVKRMNILLTRQLLMKC